MGEQDFGLPVALDCGAGIGVDRRPQIGGHGEQLFRRNSLGAAQHLLPDQLPTEPVRTKDRRKRDRLLGLQPTGRAGGVDADPPTAGKHGEDRTQVVGAGGAQLLGRQQLRIEVGLLGGLQPFHDGVRQRGEVAEQVGGEGSCGRGARRCGHKVGDFRWVAQVLDYVIFAEPENADAQALQADTFDQLGYGAENGTWRNFYLMGAYELRHGSVGTPATAAAPDLIAALTVSQLFDAVALRVDGPACWDVRITLDWNVTDESVVHRIELRNGVLVHYDLTGDAHPPAEASFTLTRPALIGLLLGGADLQQSIGEWGDPGRR